MKLFKYFITDVWKQNVLDFKEFGELSKQANCKTGKMYFRGLQYQCLIFIPVYYIPMLYLPIALPLGVILFGMSNTFIDTLMLALVVAFFALLGLLFVFFVRSIKTKAHPQLKKNLIEKFINQKEESV